MFRNRWFARFFLTLFREECSSQMKVHEDEKGGGPLPIMERKANHWAEIFINIFVFFFFLIFLSSSSILFWCCLILKCSCWDHQAVRRVPCASMKSDTSFVGAGFYSQRRSPWRREIRWMMIWKKNNNGKRIRKSKTFLNKLILFMWVYLRYVCTFREPVCRSLIKRSQFYQHFILTTYQQLMKQQQQQLSISWHAKQTLNREYDKSKMLKEKSENGRI
jgi:hypothetical protein